MSAKPQFKTMGHQLRASNLTFDRAAASRDAETSGVEALKTQFLAGLNHEIRTPLSGIIGMTDLLFETELSIEQKEYVQSTRLCAENLLELLHTTLEYASLTAGTLVLDEYEFSLAEALEVAVAQHIAKARQKGLPLLFSYDDALPATVIGDARRVRQLISHLIGNAVKFTSTGHIKVRALLSAPDELSVTIEDTGIGIEPENLALIFESFWQSETGLARQYAGLGLGLAFAQKVSILLGGAVSAESEVGEGSKFTVRLPLRKAPSTVPESANRPVVPAGPKKILVLEDNRVSQTVICHVLRRNRFDVTVVGTGTAGLEAASHEHFDLILMDLQMPEMDGIEASELIRQLPCYSDVPILALTANDSDQYRDLCERHGMQGFLSKPVHPADLIANVKKFLEPATV